MSSILRSFQIVLKKHLYAWALSWNALFLFRSDELVYESLLVEDNRRNWPLPDDHLEFSQKIWNISTFWLFTNSGRNSFLFCSDELVYERRFVDLVKNRNQRMNCLSFDHFGYLNKLKFAFALLLFRKIIISCTFDINSKRPLCYQGSWWTWKKQELEHCLAIIWT